VLIILSTAKFSNQIIAKSFYLREFLFNIKTIQNKSPKKLPKLHNMLTLIHHLKNSFISNLIK